MSGPKTGSGAGSGIPASDRKLVSSLKEIVPNSEEEIYAMLKECNMNPDETAQRLLSEGKFHVVRRKRDKKKEGAGNKESSDSRSRPSTSGPVSRGGKTVGAAGRGVGRGNSLPRYNSNEASGGRGKPSPARENGVSPTNKGSSSASASVSCVQPLAQSKGSSIDTVSSSSLPSSSIHSNGDSLHPAPPSGLQGAWLAGSGPATPTGLQGAWLAGSGHATMADILKSSGTRTLNPAASTPTSSASVPGAVPTATSSQPQLLSVPSVSGVYLAASDPVLNPSLDPRAPSSAGVVKREVGTVGNQRSIGDRSSSFILSDTSVVSSPHSQYAPVPQSNNTGVISPSDSDSDVNGLQPSNPSISAPAPYLGDRLEGVETSGAYTGSQGHSIGLVDSSMLSGLSPSRAALLGSQFTTIPAYQQQQLVGTQKGSTALDWNSQPSTHNDIPIIDSEEIASSGVVSDAVSSSPPSPSPETGMLSATAVKLQELSMQDDQPVIIPDHLRVSDADCTRLSFGSFDSGFETAFPASFGSESRSTPLSVSESAMEKEVTVAGQSATLSATSTTSSSLDQHQQHSSVSLENLVSTSDSTVSSNPIELVSQSELTKPEAVSQESPQYPFLTAAPSYTGANLVPQTHAGQYTIEQSEVRPQDINRLSNVLQPYSDPTTTYYSSGVFRPGPEVDARYSAFLPSGVTGKYGASRPAATGQSGPSQESGNAMLLSSSNSLGQTLQSGNVQTAMTVPQQSLPIHAYAAQPSALPMGPFPNVFSYHYVPPGFSYMQTPYQHNYTGTSSYHQVPTGGAAAVKYPVPQYKPGGAGMHSAVASGTIGYGGYNNSQPGTYAVNPPVTAGNTSGFDEVVASQYKDTNLYIQGQQMEGSAMWLQAQLARDMSGVQGSSYYNIPGQNQQTRYPQTQSPHAHSHPAAGYGSLYHPQQSGPSPSAHQLLQQPQGLGSVGGLGTQVGSYQQAQRAQQTWTNNF